MQKTYSFSSNGGQVSKDAGDVKLQVGNGVALRNASLEEMKNYMPDKDFFAKSINGVGLEYFIFNNPSRTFNANTNGIETLFHIYEDRIITAMPSIGKFFIDTIPEDILVDVNSVDTAIITGDSKGQFLRFNSITGIYKCTIFPVYPSNINNGEPYFSKIEIPESLTAEAISTTKGDVYVLAVKKNLTNQALLITEKDIDHDLSGFYIANSSLKVGDKVKMTLKSGAYWWSGIEWDLWATLLNNHTIESEVSKVVECFTFERNGIRKIYPKITPPKLITTSPDIRSVNQRQGFLDRNDFVDIPDNATTITVLKLKLKLSVNDLSNPLNSIPFFPSIAIPTDYPNYDASSKYGLFYKAIETMNNQDMFEKAKKVYVRFNYQKWSNIKNAYYPTSDIWCETFKNNTIAVFLQEGNQQAPTMAVVDKRLVIGYKNQVKFSAVNDLDNFNPTPNDVPTESDSFVRTLDDINEILFLAKWGTIEKGQGIVVGTPQTLVYLSSVATIFNASRIDGEAIPCSRIKPVDIRVGGIVAKFVVLNGRKEIKASVFTKDQTQSISLTNTIDFFRTDPIKKIQAMAYGDDQLLFALTDNGKLYGALTGNQMLAWFEISLKYPVRDIATSDNGGIKKLFIVSVMGTGSDYDAVGSIDFTEGVRKVKAEYYTDLYMEKDYAFSEEYPAITGNADYKTAKELTEEQKQKITKPMNGSLTLHDMQIINRSENTSNKKRQIKNVILNVKETNLLQVNYITKQNGKNEIKTTAYTLSRVDDNLNTDLVNEQIKIRKPSMVGQMSVKINIQTLDNSSIPTIIKSVQFDTEYADN